MALPKLLREIFENDGAGPKFRADKIPVTQVTVDSALSSTSENPVQNKVIKSALDGKLSTSGGTMRGALNAPSLWLTSGNTVVGSVRGGLGNYAGLTIYGNQGPSSAWQDGAYAVLRSANAGLVSERGKFVLVASLNSSKYISLEGTPDGSLTWSGTFSATTLKATSDKRKKTHITKTSADLSSLSAYRYKFKEPSEVDKGFHVGLIAQEVEKILPEAVSKDEKGFLTLDYNAVVAVLVDEVNQLKSEIKQLQAKLS